MAEPTGYHSEMGVRKSFLLLQIVFVLLAAIIIMMLAIHLATVKEVNHLPEEKVDDLRLQKMETIRADILTRLGLMEPLGSGEPLTEDQKAIVAAFRDYQTAEEARRAHANIQHCSPAAYGTGPSQCTGAVWHAWALPLN